MKLLKVPCMPDIDATQNEQTRTSRDLVPGLIVDGRFEIIGKLGEGGMSSVYKARDIALERSVAIKILHSWMLEDARAQQRFQREAQAVSLLNHPNIVRVLSVGAHEGDLYLSMDYLDGESLQERLKRTGKLAAEEAIEIALPAARALAHAHANGIIHRDIKPSNIMITTSGEVKLVDFGVAKQAQAGGVQSLTQTDAVVGTPYYMSPEQCQKEQVDARSDIYSLGCVLHEMLSGEPPFVGDSSFAVMFSHLHDDAQELPKSTPNWLAGAIRKMMAKDRAQRFQSMEEVERALQKHEAPQMVPVQRKARSKLNRHAAKLLGVMLILAAGGVFAVSVYQYRQRSDQATQAAFVGEEARIAKRNMERAVQAAYRDWSAQEQAATIEHARMELAAFRKYNPPLSQWVPAEIAILEAESGLAQRNNDLAGMRNATEKMLLVARQYPGEDRMILVNAAVCWLDLHKGVAPREQVIAVLEEADNAARAADPLGLAGRQKLSTFIEIIARTWSEQREFAKAESLAAHAVAYAERHYDPRSEATASAKYTLGTMYFLQRKPQAAAPLDEAYPILSRSADPGHIRRAVDIAQMRALRYWEKRDNASAAEVLKEAVRLDKLLIQKAPKDANPLLLLALHETQLGANLHVAGRLDEVEKALNDSARHLREYCNATSQPSNDLWADLYRTRAQYFITRKDYKQAEAVYATAIEKIDKHKIYTMVAGALCNDRSCVREVWLKDIPGAISAQEKAIAVQRNVVAAIKARKPDSQPALNEWQQQLDVAETELRKFIERYDGLKKKLVV
jgi:tRNA A-37 threonylcarbamoyl transferase component Bud32